MQIVSSGDHSHEMSNPAFCKKILSICRLMNFPREIKGVSSSLDDQFAQRSSSHDWFALNCSGNEQLDAWPIPREKFMHEHDLIGLISSWHEQYKAWTFRSEQFIHEHDLIGLISSWQEQYKTWPFRSEQFIHEHDHRLDQSMAWAVSSVHEQLTIRAVCSENRDLSIS